MDKIVMIEAGADEVPDDLMLEAILKGHINHIKLNMVNTALGGSSTCICRCRW